MSDRRLLSGNEAIALGAYEAGVGVATGYPGTPSTEILETITQYEGISAQWSPNEKVALEVGSGASYAGARTLVTMKHVGLNVAADPLFTLSYTGVGGGLVIVTADDPQLYSSQNEQDNRHYARAAKVPMLEPADSQEAREFTVLAFEISEKFDTPVLLRSTTRVSHSRTPVTAGEVRARNPVGVPPVNPAKLVMVPANAFRRHAVVEERLVKLAEFSESFAGNRIEEGTREIGIIASGVAYQYAREVFPEATFLKLGLSWPLPERLIREFAGRVEKLVVIEELDPLVEESVRAMGLAVEGKNRLPLVGEYNPTIIAERLLGRRTEGAVAPGTFALPPRPPILCPGCPHRAIFHMLRRRKYFVTGDIGCYTLAALPPLASLHTCLCMGASVGQALGIEKALGGKRERVAAVIGDSTFFHSGITPLLDIVHNGGRTLTVVLDNRTTAMTGRQDNPGTETNLMNQKVPAIDVAAVARAIGIGTVIETQGFDLESIAQGLDKAWKAEGAALIVNRGPCVLIPGQARRVAVRVDSARCTACRVCLSVACPAIGWDAATVGAKGQAGVSTVDAALCNGCGVCVQVCAFKAIAASSGEMAR